MDRSAILLPGVFSLLGVVQIGRTLLRVPGLIAASRWKEVEGEIVNSDIESEPPYKVTVIYRYTVDGRVFEGDQIHPGGFQPNTYEQASLTFHRYRPGASVTVYYDPRVPARAALEPDASWPLLAALTSGLIFFYVAARVAIANGVL
jgi:Protein of unknown function (DUF3592)